MKNKLLYAAPHIATSDAASLRRVFRDAAEGRGPTKSTAHGPDMT